MWVEGALPRSLDARVAVVTGSTSGIGLELAKLIVERNGTVVVTGRTQARCDQVVGQLAKIAAAARSSSKASKPKRQGKVVGIAADMSDLSQVRVLARKIRAQFDAVDMLFLNSGMAYTGFVGDAVSPSSGLDLLYTTNCLGPFLLCQLLLGQVESSTMPGRIAFTSSVLQFAGDAARLADPVQFAGSTQEALDAYATSKLALNVFAAELGDRLREVGSEVLVQAFAPGMVRSAIGVPLQDRNAKIHETGSTKAGAGGFERRFDACLGARYTLMSVFRNGGDLHTAILGPYAIPAALTWNRRAALGLWAVENLQKATAYDTGMYVWPTHAAVADKALRKRLWREWQAQVKIDQADLCEEDS